MNTEFRNRVFLPLFLPLAIVLGVAGVVAVFAWILLYNTRPAALVIAIVAAAGILLAISLAASRDRLDTGQRSVVVGAAVLPVLLGAIVAAGVFDIDPSQLNINREPHLVIPEDAPLIAAESVETFCFPTDGGGCEPTDTWEFAAPEDDEVVVVFQNLQAGTPHNVAFYELEDGGDPQAGESVFQGDIFEGVDTRPYRIEDGLPQGELYFQCDVHPAMQGVATITAPEGGEGGSA